MKTSVHEGLLIFVNNAKKFLSIHVSYNNYNQKGANVHFKLFSNTILK